MLGFNSKSSGIFVSVLFYAKKPPLTLTQSTTCILTCSSRTTQTTRFKLPGREVGRTLIQNVECIATSLFHTHRAAKLNFRSLSHERNLTWGFKQMNTRSDSGMPSRKAKIKLSPSTAPPQVLLQPQTGRHGDQCFSYKHPIYFALFTGACQSTLMKKI